MAQNALAIKKSSPADWQNQGKDLACCGWGKEHKTFSPQQFSNLQGGFSSRLSFSGGTISPGKSAARESRGKNETISPRTRNPSMACGAFAFTANLLQERSPILSSLIDRKIFFL